MQLYFTYKSFKNVTKEVDICVKMKGLFGKGQYPCSREKNKHYLCHQHMNGRQPIQIIDTMNVDG